VPSRKLYISVLLKPPCVMLVIRFIGASLCKVVAELATDEALSLSPSLKEISRSPHTKHTLSQRHFPRPITTPNVDSKAIPCLCDIWAGRHSVGWGGTFHLLAVCASCSKGREGMVEKERGEMRKISAAFIYSPSMNHVRVRLVLSGRSIMKT